MRTRQNHRKTITLPGRYFTGLGSPVDVQLTDLSVGGCRFAIGNQKLSLGSPVQIYVGGAGPYRANIKWVENGEAGVTFASPLSDEEFANFRNSHVPDLDALRRSGDFDDMPDTPPQRFC